MEVGETHLQGSQPRIPSPSRLAPRVPNWQGQEAPPPHWAVCLGTGLICFLPQSSCRCLLGKEGWLPSAVGQGPQPEPLSHPLSQLRPLSLPPPPPLPQEEEIPELEIDVDELLDMESDDTRAARVKVRGAGGQQGQVRAAGAKGLQGGGLPIVGSASLWRQAFLDLRQSAL